MPVKYHIHPHPTPPRHQVPGKLGIVDWREDCSSCKNCVKKGCIYGFWKDEQETVRDGIGYLDYIYQCKGCMNCVQNCTKGILSRVVNPEYKKLGDDYFTPDIILSTWYQAETGKIPVSGSGYGGKFSGPGFDSMWTDMSEIVRPTRDGIHGREYINTGIDIGRKLNHLSFDGADLACEPPALIESPMPLMFDVIPEHLKRGNVVKGISAAAAEMGIFAAATTTDMAAGKLAYGEHIVPLIEDPAEPLSEEMAHAPLVMVRDHDDVMVTVDRLKEVYTRQIVAVRIDASPAAASRALDLANAGVEVIQLCFTPQGKEKGGDDPRHMRDVIREVHGLLTKEGIRDEITLAAAGGIAMPEHMAKAIICGVDMVAIDLPLVIALECRLCGECERGENCQINLSGADLEFCSQRIINLIGAWRNQLLELLGAMGIREARRLRGETGRAMFFEDLEEQAFGKFFGKRKHQAGA